MNYEDGNFTPTSESTLTGSEALQAFANHVNSQTDSASSGFYEDLRIEGKAVDGYISGATVFIDQNFNFIKDSGEYSALTNTDGGFAINIFDADLFQCLINRPIVADVPVGAEDSTLGTVSEAYQMILPSITDAGTTSVVISPFTSLLTEAVLSGKDASNLTEDLTVDEGCTTKGDAVATKISTSIDNLVTTIAVSYTHLTLPTKA